MSLEAIKQVAQAEAEIKQRKADAAVAAKKLVADAQRAGQEALERAKADAETKARALMTQAEEKAAQQTAQVAAQTEQECSALRKAAEGNLEKAAELIVRRVVSS